MKTFVIPATVTAAKAFADCIARWLHRDVRTLQGALQGAPAARSTLQGALASVSHDRREEPERVRRRDAKYEEVRPKLGKHLAAQRCRDVWAGRIVREMPNSPGE